MELQKKKEVLLFIGFIFIYYFVVRKEDNPFNGVCAYNLNEN
jgi:hypothetical protein